MTTSMTSNVKTPSRSPFANAIAALLDRTGMFSRSEWATALGVSPAAISQWIHDKTLPRAQTLRGLLDLVKRKHGNDNDHVRAFLDLSSVPASEISPLGDRIGASLGEYFMAPLVQSFLRLLSSLSVDQQQIVIELAAAECRRLRDELPVPSSASTQVMQLSTASAQSPSTSEGDDRPVIGRKRELEQIRMFLDAGKPVLLHGASGVGKTTLIGEVIRRSLGSRHCEVFHRMEFSRRHHIFPPATSGNAGQLAKELELYCGQTLRSEQPRQDQSVYLVFEDVDMAPQGFSRLIADVVERLVRTEPRVRILVSCRRPSEHWSWSADGSLSDRFAGVRVAQMGHQQIRLICTNYLGRSATTWSDPSVERVVWLSAGSPGYCHSLVSRLLGDQAVPPEGPEIAKAARELLHESAIGKTALGMYEPLSAGAKSIVLWSSLFHGPEVISPDRLVNVLGANAGQALSSSDDLSRAIKEAESHQLIERFELGTSPVLSLKDEGLRPHLRLMAWQQFGDRVTTNFDEGVEHVM